LKDRLLFLSANFPLQTKRQKFYKYERVGSLHGGIAYNYPLIDDFSCLSDLNTFLYKILHTKEFYRINSKLTETQKNALGKYSFLAGFHRRIIRSFKRHRLGEIVKCWQ